MLADFVNFTHNGTGGSGTLTLAAVSGWPQPSDAFGTSGTRLVDYEIGEYTDGTFATPVRFERGIGSLVLSTGVLTRSLVLSTWTSGGSYNAATATALTFGNTAANIRGTLGANTLTQTPALPSTPNSNDTFACINKKCQWNSGGATLTLVTGTRYYMPVEINWGKPITSVGLNCTSIAVTGSVRMGLYDWGTNGLPGNLITEFTSATQFSVATATGYKTVTPAAPIFIPPGHYYVCIQASAAVVLQTLQHYGQSGAGSSGSRDIVYFSFASTYAALPTVADSSLTTVTLSAANQIGAFLK